MGILAHGKTLWRALFTRTQQRLLGLMFGHPERSFYANELVRLAGVGTGSVQRELARLSGAGLVRVRRVGNQKHYQANADCPIFGELRSLVLKTLGAIDHLRRSLQALDPDMELAFLYGPGTESLAPPGAELDLLVVSPGLHRPQAQAAIEAAGQQIGRRIRWVLLRPAKFHRLWQTGDAQLQEVLVQHRILLVGELPE